MFSPGCLRPPSLQETEPAGQGGAKAKVSSWTPGASAGSSDSSSAAGGGTGTCIEKAAGLLGLDVDALTRKVCAYVFVHAAVRAPTTATFRFAGLCTSRLPRMYLGRALPDRVEEQRSSTAGYMLAPSPPAHAVDFQEKKTSYTSIHINQ